MIPLSLLSRSATASASRARISVRSIPFRQLSSTVTKPCIRPPPFKQITSFQASTPTYLRQRRGFASLVNEQAQSRQLYSDKPVLLPDTPIMSSPFPPCSPIPKATGPVDLILPPTEDRPHKYFTLPNGLEVIVVSDVKADKAAASMDVGVGHLSDPDNLPGCAHFCEHLLFMGTKTYPSENEYQQYLSTNNGHSNAWTAMTSTNYYFDVAPDALEGALDRFSGFFIEPLFNEDCTEREIKAVDSEHKKNIQNDMWRFFQLEKHLSKPGHPYGKFGTGNYESLWSKPKADGRDPRQQLISWWEKEYCARRMKLAVVGKDDLATLEKWVREKFDKVPVRTEGAPEVGPNGVRVVFEDQPIGDDRMATVTFAKPVRDERGIEITFPCPDLEHLYQSRPANFISHFIGHEGRGSVLSYLKAQGWVNSLRAGLFHGAAGFDAFKITMDLTPEGLEHYQDVALAIFKYTSLLRSQPPSREAFEEIKAIADISFRYAERGKAVGYANGLSTYLQAPVPREKVVSSKWVIEEFRQDELEATLQLLDPRKATIGVTCREIPKDVQGDFDQNEPIYGTPYKTVKLSEAFLKEAIAGAPISELRLPGPNMFIPEKLDVTKFEVDKPAPRPTLLRDTPVSRLWYKRDDRFWLPKANLDVLIHSFNLFYSGDYICISAGGFSDKLAVLTETMLKKLVTFEIDEGRFSKVVDSLQLFWKNFDLGDPYRIGDWWGQYALTQTIWTHTARLQELERITPADVKAFGIEAFKRLHIETLIHGNTSPEGAKEMQEMIERVLGPRPLVEAEMSHPRSLLLPPSSEHVHSIPVPNPAEVNSAVIYTTQVCSPTEHGARAQLQLLAQIASEPVFDRLRTKEQLGYIVFASVQNQPGALNYRILVQSEKDPVYVETRIESFLQWLQGHIEEMSEDDFEKHKQSLIAKKEESPKNLGEETKRFWGRIHDKFYEFGKREAEVVSLRNTTKSDVLDLFLTRIHPSSTTRSKLSTHLKSTYKGVKFDASAAQPLVEAFTKHNVHVDQAAIGGLLASKPDLDTVKEFAMKAVQASDANDEAKKELKVVIDGLKGTVAGEPNGDGVDAEVKLKEGNVYIEDLDRFKAGLIPSRAAMPVEPLSVLARL